MILLHMDCHDLTKKNTDSLVGIVFCCILALFQTRNYAPRWNVIANRVDALWEGFIRQC